MSVNVSHSWRISFFKEELTFFELLLFMLEILEMQIEVTS